MIGDNVCCKDRSNRHFVTPFEYVKPFQFPKDKWHDDYIRNHCTICKQVWITRKGLVLDVYV